MTGDAPALRLEAVRVLPLLAPASAALQLFAHGINLDMGGLSTIRIPNVGTIAAAKFIAEGLPAPVLKFTLGSAVLGPVRKILALAATSGDLERASAESAT
jgi:hypothetical protein